MAQQAILPTVAALALTAALAVLGGCGSRPANDATKTAADFKPVGIANADPRLQAIYGQANELLPGGRARYRSRIDELKGLPIVVNKWASWCGPCAAEFPYFQSAAREMGAKVAFLGVNTNDSRDEAATFLRELPVPFPSYEDGRAEIAAEMRNVLGFPATAFYDAAGRLAYVHQGQFSSAAQLRAEIERHALGGDGGG